jgi:hypothetical protein
LVELTTRLDFFKERRSQLMEQLHNLDLNYGTTSSQDFIYRPSSPPWNWPDMMMPTKFTRGLVHSSVLHIVVSPVPLLTFNFRSLSACFRFCGPFSSADMVEFVMIKCSLCHRIALSFVTKCCMLYRVNIRWRCELNSLEETFFFFFVFVFVLFLKMLNNMDAYSWSNACNSI